MYNKLGDYMKNFIRLMLRAKKYHKFIIIGFIGLIMSSSAQLFTPKLTQRLIKLVTDMPSDLPRQALNLAIILFFAYLAQAAGQYLRTLFMHKAAWGYIADLRVDLFKKLEWLSVRFYTNKQTGELVSRVVNDTAALESLLAHCLPDLLVNGILFIGVLVILLFINVKLTLISMITLPLIFLFVYMFTKVVRPLFKKSHAKVAELSAVIQDDFSGIKEIQVFNKQEVEAENVKKASYSHRDTIMSALKKSALFHPASELANNLGAVIITAVGGFMAYKSQLDASEIVAFLFYINMLYRPVNMLGRLSEDLQNSLAASDRVYELFDTESEVRDKEDAYEIDCGNGEIEFKNVDFAYNKAEVLKDISIKINSGETIALVGPTGVGKTTFINLLARFYDPVSGDIFIDGHNLKDIKQSSLRDNISMVLQDVFLFNGSVYENIAYGVENPTYEEVINAAKVANADEFITQMEKGYDTYIGERGVRLSGGQKQRIAIARAVLRNRPVLILDEATASVDTKTEKYIQQAIDKISKNKTTIIIAHRLSTVKNADRIIVLDEGKIAEIGTHNELYSKDGIYKKLCDMQFS